MRRQIGIWDWPVFCYMHLMWKVIFGSSMVTFYLVQKNVLAYFWHVRYVLQQMSFWYYCFVFSALVYLAISMYCSFFLFSSTIKFSNNISLFCVAPFWGYSLYLNMRLLGWPLGAARPRSSCQNGRAAKACSRILGKTLGMFKFLL